MGGFSHPNRWKVIAELASYIGNSIVVCRRANAARLASPSRLRSKKTPAGKTPVGDCGEGEAEGGENKVGRNKRTLGTNYSHHRRRRRRRRRCRPRRARSLFSSLISKFIFQSHNGDLCRPRKKKIDYDFHVNNMRHPVSEGRELYERASSLPKILPRAPSSRRRAAS